MLESSVGGIPAEMVTGVQSGTLYFAVGRLRLQVVALGCYSVIVVLYS